MTVKNEVKQLMANRGVDVLSEDGETVTFVGRGNRKVAEYDFGSLSYSKADDIAKSITASMQQAKSD